MPRAAPVGGFHAHEPERAKRATARYHDVRQAIADGYVDINVVRPNMRRHFLTDSLVDAKFEVERPELVYSPENGRLPLVAVEYCGAPQPVPGGAGWIRGLGGRVGP